jgi:hypothetical protein
MTDEFATPRAPESWAANVVPDKMQLHTLALEVLTKLSKNPTFSTSDDGESELIVDSGEMRGQVSTRRDVRARRYSRIAIPSTGCRN